VPLFNKTNFTFTGMSRSI